VHPASSQARAIASRSTDRPTWLGSIGSAPGGEIESDAPLAVFDALQVLLPIATGDDASEILDGKVIALSEHEGARTALVRFTGIDWDTQARIEAFARRDQGMTLPGPTRA